jgi:hypothetical protein
MLGPELLLGAGPGPMFVLIFLVGLTKVNSSDAGVAASLINVGQQVGGAVGLAILGTVAWSAVASSLHSQMAAAARAGAHRPAPAPPHCRPACTTTRWPPDSPGASWSPRASWCWR